MQRKALSPAVIFCLLFSLAVVDLAVANPSMGPQLPSITINSDGSVSPPIYQRYINRTGNIYTLKSDLVNNYFIDILCSDIVFDGQAHTLNTTISESNSIVINAATNVTVRNLLIDSSYVSVHLRSCTDCRVIGVDTLEAFYLEGSNNVITECSGKVILQKGSCNNLIISNNISSIFVSTDCFFNKFLQNNFCLTDYPRLYSSNSWDNGSVGNYWGNYSTRYPNASEVGNTGIGDTAYLIERDSFSETHYPNAVNVDNHPLVRSSIINSVVSSPTVQPQENKPSNIEIPLILISSILLIGISACLVYYRKRRKMKK